MSCDYRIQGEATVRNTPEVMKAINQLGSDVRGEDYLTVTQVDANTLQERNDSSRALRKAGSSSRPDHS